MNVGADNATNGRDKRVESHPAAGSDGDSSQEFLDLLMPVYPRALAYAQAITGSLMDGEDLLHDTVLRALSRFNQLRNRERFCEWFFAILLNRFRNLHNRNRLRPVKLVAGLGGSDPYNFWEATAKVSQDPAELGYQLTLVRELLARLKPRERDVLLLLGPAGFSPEEVAGMMKTTRRAVIQLSHRARKKLRRMLPDGELPVLSVPAKGVSSDG
jgi:RNA polymerase sigma-70 factor (ECF subfamily)